MIYLTVDLQIYIWFLHTLLQTKSKLIFLVVSDMCNVMYNLATGSYEILMTVSVVIIHL
jgi:hypothetical protein